MSLTAILALIIGLGGCGALIVALVAVVYVLMDNRRSRSS